MVDLPDRFNAAHAGCFIRNKHINYLMYADDLCYFDSSFDGVQDLGSVCSKYMELHCIAFNASKSMGMIFHVEFSNILCLNCILLVIQTNLGNSVKYLGIHLN